MLSLVVGGLGVLALIIGFLPSSSLRSARGFTRPLGSVFHVIGWSPALLFCSGLLALAALLPSVSKPTMWAVSAAAGAAGGVGALSYLFAKAGTDAGLGLAVDPEGTVGYVDSASIGLILLVVVGVVQVATVAIAAVATGLIPSAGMSRPGTRQPRPAPGQPAAGPTGPGFPGAGFPQGHPGAGYPAAGYPTPSGYPPPGYRQPGFEQFPPPDHQQTVNRQPEPSGSARLEQPMPPSTPSGQPEGSPPVYDPQAGRSVYSGQTPAGFVAAQQPPWQPTDYEPAPAWANSTAAGQSRPIEQEPAQPQAQYTQVDYGSADYEWEPTYSEAPDYEARAEESADAPAAQVHREQAFLYETPEWERPQYEPPHLDSGRHEGWDAGYDHNGDQSAHGTPPPGPAPHHRSIPRAE